MDDFISISRQDLKVLCDTILSNHLIYNDSDYGKHTYSCEYCGCNDFAHRGKGGVIEHSTDCPVLVAKQYLQT